MGRGLVALETGLVNVALETAVLETVEGLVVALETVANSLDLHGESVASNFDPALGCHGNQVGFYSSAGGQRRSGKLRHKFCGVLRGRRVEGGGLVALVIVGVGLVALVTVGLELVALVIVGLVVGQKVVAPGLLELEAAAHPLVALVTVDLDLAAVLQNQVALETPPAAVS